MPGDPAVKKYWPGGNSLLETKYRSITTFREIVPIRPNPCSLVRHLARKGNFPTIVTEIRLSVKGHVKPPVERRIFGLAAAERTVGNPPGADRRTGHQVLDFRH